MKDRISFHELPRYVPGTSWIDSKRRFGDGGIVIRGFDYPESDVSAPPLEDDFMAFYVAGEARAARTLGGRAQAAWVGPGAASFLPRGVTGRWRWDGAIRVVHVYLPRAALRRTCAAVSSRDPERIELHDGLAVEDPVLPQLVAQMTDECRGDGFGSGLCFEALSQQLAVHLLRRHFHNVGPLRGAPGRLSGPQAARLRDLIEANLAQDLTLGALAREMGMSETRLTRSFRASFGQSIHQYVLERRLLRARTLLADPELSVADVAYRTGFSDQSHLTRFFRRAFDATPAAWRRAEFRR